MDGFVGADIDIGGFVGQLPCVGFWVVQIFARAIVRVGNDAAFTTARTRIAVGFFLGFDLPRACDDAVDGLIRAFGCVTQ